EIPDADDAGLGLPTAARVGEMLPVGAEHETGDAPALALERVTAVAAGHVPYLDGTVEIRAGEPPTVGAEGDGLHASPLGGQMVKAALKEIAQVVELEAAKLPSSALEQFLGANVIIGQQLALGQVELEGVQGRLGAVILHPDLVPFLPEQLVRVSQFALPLGEIPVDFIRLLPCRDRLEPLPHNQRPPTD